MHNWARTQAREPPLPLACRHLFHTTSGRSLFAYLLIVALPPFPILPLGVKHSISDLCWASLLSLYLVSVNKDRSKQKDVIVCFTARLRKHRDRKHGHPAPKQGLLLLAVMEATLGYLLDDVNGIRKNWEWVCYLGVKTNTAYTLHNGLISTFVTSFNQWQKEYNP